MKEYVKIYIKFKTQKNHRNKMALAKKMKYHFHITTLHKYTQLK